MFFRGPVTLVVLFYAAVPAVALGYALWARHRERRVWPLASFAISCIAGGALGVGGIMVNRWLMDGAFSVGEYVRAAYVGTAAMCLLKLIDHWLLKGLFRAARVRLDGFGRPSVPNHPRALLLLFTQRLIMLFIVTAYGSALLMAYRPKATFTRLPDDTKSLVAYTPVSFPSADGLSLRGGWIDAGKMPALLDAEVAGEWGKRCVLLCHGVGSSKEHLLPLARLLSESGFNVFIFDFRGHGESGGHFISYGDRERLDVLGAIEWIKTNRSEGATRLFGLGLNTGAAALIGAGVETGKGERLNGFILYEPFARFEAVADDAVRRMLPRALGWVVDHVSVPLAGLHGGSDLTDFAPVEGVARLWPRPVLVIHGQGEGFVPNIQTMDVFQRANYPKEQFWPSDNYRERMRRQREKSHSGNSATLAEMFREFVGTAELLTKDPGVLHRTLRFLYEAEPSPVI